ncbi:CLUMA_CG011389, isoform A, partial [Clunio marinus]
QRLSPKQWFSLLAFYISYLFFGASVFYHEEHRLETERRAVAYAERVEINALLVRYIAPNNSDLQDEVLDQVSDYCNQPVTHPSDDEYVPPYIWNFYHSIFFAFTICSTIGYGNISPNNTFGRMFLIFYALIGIPVHTILFAYMGEFWGRTFVRLYNRYKRYKLSSNHNWVPPRLNLVAQVILYFVPALIVLIFLPSILFSYFEQWDYSISVYYSFVTLTTIGFGDYVPTFQPEQERSFGIYFVFYQIFIFLWFTAGLGYLLMIIGFIIEGMRSKRMKKLEHHLAMNLKLTQKKIWHGVTKDVGFIRNILNEAYFLKFKPVYKNAEEAMQKFAMPKSQSCPDLSKIDDEVNDYETLHTKPRARAYSLCVQQADKNQKSLITHALSRVQSDSKLSNIDKEKTFAYDARRGAVQPGDLLAKLVVALGGFRPETDEQKLTSLHSSITGLHGFSDSQILSSENNYYSDWSITESERSLTTPTTRQRHSRAASEVRIPIDESVKKPNYFPFQSSTGWTWSGSNTQISEIEKIRSLAAKPKENLYKASLQSKLRYDSEANADDFPREVIDKDYVTATSNSVLSKLNPFKKKMSQQMKRHSLAPGSELDPSKYFRRTHDGRASVSSLSKNYLSHHRPSLFAMPCMEEEGDLLETTTIADLIRAIEQVHSEHVDTSLSFEATRNDSSKKNVIQPHQSLLTLNSPNIGRRSSYTSNGPSSDILPLNITKRNRLYSCVSTPSSDIGDNRRERIQDDAKPFIRHLSIRPPPPYTTVPTEPLKPALKRRFSVRPSNLDSAPGQFHKTQNSPTIATQLSKQSSPLMFQRKLSWRPTPSSLANIKETQKIGQEQSESTSPRKPT